MSFNELKAKLDIPQKHFYKLLTTSKSHFSTVKELSAAMSTLE